MIEHLKLLGINVRDKVTGFTGVVSCVCFDLYGCVQATVTPPVDKDGKKPDVHWFDVSRLSVLCDQPVMVVPNFEGVSPADWSHGPSERPNR